MEDALLPGDGRAVEKGFPSPRTESQARTNVRAGFDPTQSSSLSSVHANTSVRALRVAERARLQRHEDVVVAGVHGDAVRINACSHMLQPGVGLGIDHAQHRSV